jgi:hypothetical protein
MCPRALSRGRTVITSVIPRVFFNLGKEKHNSTWMSARATGTTIAGAAGDNWDFYGSAAFTRQLTKKVSFQVSDQFTSSFNDSWSFLSLYSPLPYETGALRVKSF